MRILALFLVGILWAGAASAATDSLGTIVGRVVRSDGAEVRMTVLVLGTQCSAPTDEKGRFVILNVPTGDRELRILGTKADEPLTRKVTVVPGVNRLEEIAFTTGSPKSPVPERLDIGSRTQASELVAEIRSVKGTYKFGDSPRFEVRIWNRGTNPVVLVKCVEGSDAGRSPRGEWKVAAPFDGFVRVRSGVGADSPGIGVGAADFIEVVPGEAFDPYMDGLVPDALAGSAVTRPGHYTVTFRYATTDRSPRAWLGPDVHAVSPELLELLARVPAVELTAKTNFKVDF
jgi:hypothetical protein